VFNDKTITPADKQAIIKYIQELQKQENPGGLSLGRLGTVTEGLFLFIVGLGALIGIAVWIGAKAK
jgi:ubiquinol-cytochrome c reductase cytochrome c subunit